MALLFVHGVNTRSDRPPRDVTEYIDRYLSSPFFGDGPPQVVYSFWGDMGGRYRFDGRSRPRTRIVGQGGAGGLRPSAISDVNHVVETLTGADSGSGSDATSAPGVVGGMGSGPTPESLRLRDLDRAEAVAALLQSAENAELDDRQQRELLVVISELADDDGVWLDIEQAVDRDAELAVVAAWVDNRIDAPSYAAQGSDWLDRFRDSAEETLRRAASAPALALSTGLGELRPKIDRLLEQFVGDVFTYLDSRLPEPEPPPRPADFPGSDAAWGVLTSIAGPIPRTVIVDLLRCADLGSEDEPLVVLSHSMGGQIMYELFATFLPRFQEALTHNGIDLSLPTVDLWCASASQVGLFEELSVFLSSGHEPGVAAPFPGRFLRNWWNVWDLSDLLSFTVDGIVHGVDDGEFFSGRGFVGAHSGYLERPSFYRTLADKIDETMDAKGQD